MAELSVRVKHVKEGASARTAWFGEVVELVAEGERRLWLSMPCATERLARALAETYRRHYRPRDVRQVDHGTWELL